MGLLFIFGTIKGVSIKMKRLGQAVKSRRDDLRLSQRAVGQAGGPSNSVMTTIENGVDAPIAPSTFSKLDAALQWEPGSARRVYEDGGEPTEVAAPGASESAPLFPGGTAGVTEKLDEAAASLWAPGTTLGDLDATVGQAAQQANLRAAGAVRAGLRNPGDAETFAKIRASYRENLGKTGPTPDLVRAVATDHLDQAIAALDRPRRALVVEYTYRLLDEQDAEGGGVRGGGAGDAGGAGGTPVDDLAARRDSNTREGEAIRNVVDDDDPTAGIDPQRYAAHPRTDQLDEDNPTP